MKSAALDRKLFVPLYHQLKEILLEEIRTGKLKPEDRLPSEDEVASAYGVSIITVRRTLSDLANEGYIRRERGRGTFIAQPAVRQGPRVLTSFSQEMLKRGLSSTSKVLARELRKADAEMAAQLEIEERAKIFVLRRLRLADGEPMGIQTAHLPLAMVPGIMEETFHSASLYETLKKRFGLEPAHAREIHTAVLIGAEDAAIPRRSAAVAAKRLTFLADGRPFEFVTSLMRGDRYEIMLDLTADPPSR
jgi:GntR family transcriptional regulator